MGKNVYKLSLEEIKSIEKDILGYVASLCDKNKLRYFLAYGTLIGAIRHKGFIPWDDDMDIAMPQPDYERFLKEWKNTDDLALYAVELGNSKMLIARICDIKATNSYERVLWKKGESGVWIDIFPISAVPSDMAEYKKHIKRLHRLETLAYYSRYNDVRPSMFSSVRDKMAAAVKMFAFRWINRAKVIRDVKKYAYNTYDWSTSEYVGCVTFLDYPDREHLPKDWWEHFEMTKFEDAEFSIVSSYDSLLRNYYGDYMQFPPVEQRVPVHASGQWFYWK